MKYRVICSDHATSPNPDGASWITSFMTSKQADNFARRMSASLTYSGNGVQFYLYNGETVVIYRDGSPI